MTRARLAELAQRTFAMAAIAVVVPIIRAIGVMDDLHARGETDG